MEDARLRGFDQTLLLDPTPSRRAALSGHGRGFLRTWTRGDQIPTSESDCLAGSEAGLFLTLSLLSFPSLAALKTTFLNSMAVLEAPRAAECIPEPCRGGGAGADAAAAAASAEGILRSSSTLDYLMNW